MSGHIPHQALSFGAHAIKLASSHGFKGGLAKAAAKANPVFMVLGAAEAVLNAASSWLRLKEARVHRDGLRDIIPKEEAALRAGRQQLKEELDLARGALEQEAAMRERIGKINLLCARVCHEIFSDMLEIRKAEIPDVDHFEQLGNELDIAWSRMRTALDYYNRTTD